jgi:hypothetical protein
MGYMHINNLYKDQRMLMFKRCYALEKVHGTSAHVTYKEGFITYFSGGEKHENFIKLFDDAALKEAFDKLGYPEVTVYGEAYGGKCQGMKDTYGPELKFIAFDVMVGETWLSVPDMDQVATGLGFEVVPWEETDTDLATLDHLRDRPSQVAIRRGCANDAPRLSEGVVLRPLIELRTSNGERVMCKHKGAAFEETRTPRKVADPSKLEVLAQADAIAQEWVTPMRLSHVIDKLLRDEKPGMEHTGVVIKAMVEDVYREAAGEIVESKEAKQAIGKRAAALFKARITVVPA